MYLAQTAGLHAKHTGERVDWLKVFWPRGLCAMAATLAVLLIADAAFDS